MGGTQLGGQPAFSASHFHVEAPPPTRQQTCEESQHPFPQQADPLEQDTPKQGELSHPEPWQIWPAGQMWPQLAQLEVSLVRSAHFAPQQVRFDEQFAPAQVPPVEVLPLAPPDVEALPEPVPLT